MNDTGKNEAAKPSDPAMAASNPEMFAPLTTDESYVLTAHLSSGWAKQRVVYPVLDEAWKETSATLTDLHNAWDAAFQAEREAEAGQ